MPVVYVQKETSFLLTFFCLLFILSLFLKPGQALKFPRLTFTTFHSDRDFSASKEKGCGMLSYIDSSLKSVRRKDLESFEESIWLDISLKRREKLLIGCFYLPARISPALFIDVISSIECLISTHNGHKIIFLGDFNVPGLAVCSFIFWRLILYCNTTQSSIAKTKYCTSVCQTIKPLKLHAPTFH